MSSTIISKPAIIAPSASSDIIIKASILRGYIMSLIVKDNRVKLASHYIPVWQAADYLQPDLMAQASPWLAAVQAANITHLSFPKPQVLAAYEACCLELFNQPQIPTRSHSFHAELLDAAFLITDNLAYDLSLVPGGQDLKVFSPRDGKSLTIPKAAITRWRNALLGTARCRADRLKWQLDIDMI